jgi:hypothetical protein
MWWRTTGPKLLRPYERLVVDAVRERLEPDAAARLVRQLETIELVRRDLDDRDVYLYPNRRGPQRHDPATAFPDRSEDLRLATVRVAGPSGTGKADLHVVLGHLFQIAFRPRPRDLGDRREIRVDSVAIHVDPMIAREDAGIEDRLADLDPVTRAELESMWADGSAEAAGLGARGGVFRIGLDDGDFLLLGQLADTTFVVAPIDPARPGIRRYSADGDLEGEYPDLRTALAD